MPRWTGKIRGTINDDFEIEADTEDEAREAALNDWRYVEFEDLEVDHIKEQDDDTSLRPRPGESAQDTLDRVIQAVRNKYP